MNAAQYRKMTVMASFVADGRWSLTEEEEPRGFQFNSKYFIVRCNRNNETEFFLWSHQLCHINNLVKLNTLKTEAGIKHKNSCLKNIYRYIYIQFHTHIGYTLAVECRLVDKQPSCLV